MRVLLVVVLLGACGSDAPAGGAPLDPDDAQALCEDTCAHELSCSWIADAGACRTGCTSQSSLFRADGYRSWLVCLAAADCSAANPGEACYLDAVADTAPRDVHEDYVGRCTAAQATCTLPSGVCGIEQVQLFTDAYMTNQVLPCFDLACSALSACLETNVLDAF